MVASLSALVFPDIAPHLWPCPHSHERLLVPTQCCRASPGPGGGVLVTQSCTQHPHGGVTQSSTVVQIWVSVWLTSHQEQFSIGSDSSVMTREHALLAVVLQMHRTSIDFMNKEVIALSQKESLLCWQWFSEHTTLLLTDQGSDSIVTTRECALSVVVRWTHHTSIDFMNKRQGNMQFNKEVHLCCQCSMSCLGL